MPSRPFGATPGGIRRFSRRKLSTSGYSAAEKRLSRQDARISVSVCDKGLCGFGLKDKRNKQHKHKNNIMGVLAQDLASRGKSDRKAPEVVVSRVLRDPSLRSG